MPGYIQKPMLTAVPFALMTACGANSLSHLPKQNHSDVKIVRSESSVSTAPDIVKKSTVMLDIGSYTTCSGTLVAEDKVLTAAHCVKDLANASSVVVRFGPDQSSSQYGRLGVGAPRVHNKLDLAVLRFEGGIPAGYQVAPIHPETAYLNPGNEVVIAGYGRTSADSNDAGKFLRWGKTKFTEFKEQIDYVDGQSFRSILQFNTDPEGSSVCGGDSGGPVYRFFNGTWALTGVISGGPVWCQSPISESLAADPRPNHAFILKEFTEKVPNCQVASNAGYAHLRFWDDASDVSGALRQGVSATLLPGESAPKRSNAQVSAWVFHKNTACAADVWACKDHVEITDTTSKLGEAAGTTLRAGPSKETADLGVVQKGTYVRVIERRPSGWIRIAFEATVSVNACKASQP